MARSNGKKILIVDDAKPSDLKDLVELLELKGYSVEVAHNKLEAETLYLGRGREFDAILVDSLEAYDSSTFNGLDLIDEFRDKGCDNVYFYSSFEATHPQQEEAANRGIPKIEKDQMKVFFEQLEKATGLKR